MATLLDYALTDVAAVKESLGLAAGNTQYDNLIVRKINQATEVIERYCNRRFKKTTYTDEEYDGTYVDTLMLKQRPITALTSFQRRDTSQNEDSWDNIESELYFRDDQAGIIELNFAATGRWNRYRVSYTAGYETIPADIAEACATLAAWFVSNADGTAANLKRKEEGQRRVEYRDGSSTSDVIKALGLDITLDSYNNHPLGP